MRVRRIVVGEVDEATLFVPDVFAVHGDRVADGDRRAPADVDVVVYEHGLRHTPELHDETLMSALGSVLVGEQSRDLAVRGDLDAGAVFGEIALDRRVAGRRGSARPRRENERGRERAPRR